MNEKNRFIMIEFFPNGKTFENPNRYKDAAAIEIAHHKANLKRKRQGRTLSHKFAIGVAREYIVVDGQKIEIS